MSPIQGCFKSTDVTSLDFCLWFWIKSDVYKTKVDTRYDLLARIVFVSAANTKKTEDQLKRKTRDLNTRVAKCTELDGGILKHSLRTVTNLTVTFFVSTVQQSAFAAFGFRS